MKNRVLESLAGAKLLSGKTAVVTGGGSGIGAAICRMFADQGAKITIVDLDSNAARSVENMIIGDGGAACAIEADITREKDVDMLFEAVAEKFGTLDIVVNNAGGGLPTRFLDIRYEEWERIIALNLSATFRVSQGAARIMNTKDGGSIINIASLAGRSTSPTAGCHYTASKAGVIGLTRHMARELAGVNIRVNAVCPGVINTARIAARIAEQGSIRKMRRSIPMGRLGEVEEVAGCCLFLASGLSGFVTGASIDVNGGALMI